MRIKRVDRKLARAPAGEQPHQSTFRNVRAEREAWTNDNAMSGQRDAIQECRIRGRERAGDAHRLGASVRTSKAPGIRGLDFPVDEAGVSSEVARLLRMAGPLQIGRRCADNKVGCSQSSRDEIGISP